jgi:alcohol dehydrogenase class IV
VVFDTLPASYAGDKGAREAMHYAQCLAGMSFTSAMLGISHAMAHKTGGMFDPHIPHGLANAIYLPYVVQYNAKDSYAKGKYVQLAKYVGIAGADDDTLVAGLVEKTRVFTASFGTPGSLKEYGIPEDEWASKVGQIAVNAMADELIISNPRDIDTAIMEKVLRYIYEGKDIDF